MRLVSLVLLAACTPIPDEGYGEPVDSDLPEPLPALAPTAGDHHPDPVLPPPAEDTDVEDTDVEDTDVEDTDPPRDLSGTITWARYEDGTRACRMVVEVRGDVAEACAGCDEAWDVDVDVIEEEGACRPGRPELLAGGRLAWSRRWEDPYREVRYRSVVLSGDDDDVWVALQRRDDPRGLAERTETALTWDADQTWGQLLALPDAYDDCGSSVRKRAAMPPSDGTEHAEQVPCDGTTVDAWSVSAPAGGATVAIDTVFGAPPFDPYVWVNDADGCTVYESDDVFACTEEPPEYGCPGLTLPEGDYTVYVGSRGQCSAGDVDYLLQASAGASATLDVDDAATGAVRVHRTVVDAALITR